MSDKPLLLDIPEELLAQAQAAHVDMRRIVIEALENEVRRSPITDTSDEIKPSLEEIEAAIAASMRRVASGEVELRVLGLNKGTIWVSDDFDDPLPDELWLGGDPASIT